MKNRGFITCFDFLKAYPGELARGVSLTNLREKKKGGGGTTFYKNNTP